MPDATDNDPWADLYADLGVTEKPARPAPAPHAEAAHPGDAADESAEGDDGDEDSDTEGGDGVATADDGTTKKRRRRRRRGKKKPGEETAPGSEGVTGDGPDENETPEYGRHAAQPTAHRSPAPVADYESDIDAEGETDDAGQPAEVSAEAERPLEGATTEMTRELIANWNVPSWEDLVTGLHRPSH